MARGESQPELLVDFIISLDGYAAADDWPGLWGLGGTRVLRVAGAAAGPRPLAPDGRDHVPADVRVRRPGPRREASTR